LVENLKSVKELLLNGKQKNKISPQVIREILLMNHILNAALTPPFTIEDETDGGEDIRMKYRYLDISDESGKKTSLLFRQVAMEVHKYLSDLDFLCMETPYLIKFTRARILLCLRMNPVLRIATTLLRVGGMDKYFQIVMFP
jgi:aspartyl-tRNA synthetase